MSVVERAINKLRRSGGSEDATPSRALPAGEGPIGTLSVTVGREESAETTHHEGQPDRLILVDRQAVRAAGYLPEASQDRQFADHYRHIKRPLIAAAMASKESGAGSPRLIMMSSALPGDGKTFTSINLALSMARERDTSVVLIDADVAKPHISRIFGVDQEPGLLDALADDSLDVESLILKTDVSGLSILPAGRSREGATELLASARMAQIVARIIARNPRRMALFDSSPLLVSSESSALAAVVGQVVLVVRACKTPQQAILDAIGILGEGKAVGLVLNQGKPSITQSYYGQGVYGDAATSEE